MTTQPINGILIIADLSGYTGFIAKCDIERSNRVLSQLLALLVTKLKSRFNIVKLEGDAVFAHYPVKPEDQMQWIIEFVNNLYYHFRIELEAINSLNSCTCSACSNIENMDLKVFVHLGNYIIQNIAGITDLIGNDVNIIHRLTKNSITTKYGWQGYFMITEEINKYLKTDQLAKSELFNYEHLGEIKTMTIDLRSKYDEGKFMLLS